LLRNGAGVLWRGPGSGCITCHPAELEVVEDLPGEPIRIDAAVAAALL
jgi:hypothetical protein